MPEKETPAELPANWEDTYRGLSDESRKIFWKRTVCRIECFRDRTLRIFFSP
ncbi:MAG: hypothetical protein IKD79_02135 [Oscillospiraceae bacterium]|nr:hypothetical protein [Oscillospiraceae bacterium]